MYSELCCANVAQSGWGTFRFEIGLSVRIVSGGLILAVPPCQRPRARQKERDIKRDTVVRCTHDEYFIQAMLFIKIANTFQRVPIPVHFQHYPFLASSLLPSILLPQPHLCECM